MPLVLRSAKGSQLTTAEMDGNLSYLESLNAALPPVTISGTSATLDAATHANRLLICTNASPVTLTLTTDGVGGWANDDSINAIQYGAGAVTIVAVGATLRAPQGSLATTAAQYRLVGSTRIGASEWTLTEVSGGSGTAATMKSVALTQAGYIIPTGYTTNEMTYLGVRPNNTITLDSSTAVGVNTIFRSILYRSAAAAVNRTAGFYNNTFNLFPNLGTPGNGRFPFVAAGGIGDANPTLGTGFMGITEQFSALLNTGDASTFTSCIGIGYDSADTNWQVMHNDATGTCTKIDMGASFPRQQNTPLILVINKNSGGTSYVVEVTNFSTGAVYTSPDLTTNLPNSSATLAAKIARGSSASAIQVDVYFGGFYCGVPA